MRIRDWFTLCFISFLFYVFVSGFPTGAVTLLMVPQGGTGAGTFTAGDVLQGNGTSAIQGSAMSGDATLAAGGALTISADAIEESMLKVVDSPADEECLTYESTGGDFEWQSCGSGSSGATQLSELSDVGTVAYTSGYVLKADGTDYDSVQLGYSDLSGNGSASITTLGTIATGVWNGTSVTVSHGGTGAGTFTAGDVLQGNGTSAIQGSAMSGDATLAAGGALTISADAIEESMLKAVDSPADEECLTYEVTTGDFEWQTCGSGSSGATQLSELSDVGTVAYTSGYVLKADGADYDSAQLGYSDLSGNGSASITTLGTVTTGVWNGTSIADANVDNNITIDLAATATALASNGSNCSAGYYPLGVDASGAVESCTADANTTYTAGRSLTLSGTDILADSELYHNEKCLYFENPTDDDDFKSLFHFRKAATITGMWCESDQTVNMDLQLDDGTPADINGTDLVCDSTPADDTSLGGDTGAAAGERLDLAITSVSGTPTWVSICFDFTYDD